MLLKSLLLALAAVAGAGALTPAAEAAPPNDHLANARIMPVSGNPSLAYSLVDATLQPGEPTVGSGGSVWFAWKPATTGGAYVDVCGSPSGGHRVRAFRLPAGTPLGFAGLVDADAGDAAVPGASPCRERWIAKAGEQYLLQVGGHGDWTVIRQQDDVAPGKPAWKTAPPPVTGPSRTFTWSAPADTDVVGYDCLLDGAALTPCTATGTTVSGLEQGAHQLQVKSRDAYGNRSPALITSWTVDATGPETTGPGLWFSSPEDTATFQCSIDGAEWYGCTSPLGVKVGPGLHEVRIRAVDTFGNVDPTPLFVTVGTPLQPPAAAPAPPVVVPSTPAPTPAPLPPASPCGVAVQPPMTLTRAALRRGVTLRLTAPRRCTATLELRRGRTSLAEVSRVVEANRPATVRLRAAKARRGKLSLLITDGTGTRTSTVRVR